ncbi:MAG: hypothetical protein R3F46_13700 [bacterium]
MRKYLIILFVASCCSGCGGSDPGGEIPLIIAHSASLRVLLVEDGQAVSDVRDTYTAEGPLTLALRMSFGNVPTPSPDVEMVSRYELDFGDGNGWMDVTQQARSWHEAGSGPDTDVSKLSRVLLSEPGEYLLRGRITYWDGEVAVTTHESPYANTDVLVIVE